MNFRAVIGGSGCRGRPCVVGDRTLWVCRHAQRPMHGEVGGFALTVCDGSTWRDVARIEPARDRPLPPPRATLFTQFSLYHSAGYCILRPKIIVMAMNILGKGVFCELICRTVTKRRGSGTRFFDMYAQPKIRDGGNWMKEEFMRLTWRSTPHSYLLKILPY